MSIKIHETLPKLRKSRGLTQEQLAQALFVSNQAVSKWENQQCCPDIELLPIIAEYFGITIEELLCGSKTGSVPEETPVRDELEEKILQIVGETGRVYTSLLVRKLRIGYGEADRLLKKLERDGLLEKSDEFRYRRTERE